MTFQQAMDWCSARQVDISPVEGADYRLLTLTEGDLVVSRLLAKDGWEAWETAFLALVGELRDRRLSGQSQERLSLARPVEATGYSFMPGTVERLGRASRREIPPPPGLGAAAPDELEILAVRGELPTLSDDPCLAFSDEEAPTDQHSAQWWAAS